MKYELRITNIDGSPIETWKESQDFRSHARYFTCLRLLSHDCWANERSLSQTFLRALAPSPLPKMITEYAIHLNWQPDL